MRTPENQSVIIIDGIPEFHSWKGPGLLHWRNLKKVFSEMQWFINEYFPGETPANAFKHHYSSGLDGANELGEWWAYLNGVETLLFFEDPEEKKDSRGSKRNSRMVQAAINATELSNTPPCLVVLWDGESYRVADLVEKAKNADFWLHLVKI